ncbi:hypothetical protein [Streptomyces pseudogriseolus]|uniref:hypothetical protein n=1 Tax=Streptomyces pseudogriseolus TaxID=36817 RepID=UPI003FA25BC7
MHKPQHLTDSDGQVVLDDFGLPIEDKTGWQPGQQLQEEAWTNGGRTGTFVKYLGDPTDPDVLIEVRSAQGTYGHSPIDRWTADVTPGAWEPTEGMVTIKNRPRDFPEASRMADEIIQPYAKYLIDGKAGVQPVTGHRLGYQIAKSLGQPGTRVEVDEKTGAIAITTSRIEKTVYRPSS